ncbi:hypothetical protein TX25_09745 [Pseudomonas lactis]|nr:hypothetical protein TX25_09745 [Pseudomonas lactis]
MLGPKDVGLGAEHVRFQRLNLGVSMMKDGVEPEITQAQDADFVTGRFSSVDISVCEGGTKAIGGRVAENDQNALTHGDKF